MRSGDGIEDEEVFELGSKFLGVWRVEVVLDKGLSEVPEELNLLCDFSVDFLLIAVHDPCEYDPHDVDTVDDQELHYFPDDFGVLHFVQQEGLVVVNEQLDEVHFQLLKPPQ